MVDYRSIQMKEETSLNVCATCEIGQHCCTNLSGLKLSKAEFKRNFLHFRKSLLIEEYRGIYRVSGRGNSCPNWRGDQCAVYGDRPIECRFFPYTIAEALRICWLVVLTYHHQTLCPQKDRLLAQRTEAVDMLVSFAEDAFGRDVRVVIIPDILPLSFARRLVRLPHKIASAVAQAARGG